MLFEIFLTLATLLCLGLVAFDKLFLRKSSAMFAKKRNIILEYAYSFLPVLAIVLVLRTFVMEPFRIPSGSMRPTLLIGDFILVNKSAYGLRLPILGTKLVALGKPKIGDIVVFRQKSSGQDIIKRVVGVPGSIIEYKNEQLYVDNQLMKTEFVRKFYDDLLEIVESKEDLLGIEHYIYHYPHLAHRVHYNFTSVTVPNDCYFVMGDNRNDSNDSRFGGFVYGDELLGKAVFTWLSIDTNDGFKIRFTRFGKKIV